MSRLVIQGGKRLEGAFKPSGNKNAALPMLAASMLTDEELVLRNIPLIDDVLAMMDILRDLGVSVKLTGHTVRLCSRGVRKRKLNGSLCDKVRTSILFAGPMCARFGRVKLFPPGGDVIGRRRLDTHFMGLKALGVDIGGEEVFSFKSRGRLRGADMLLDEASVTATENIMMAATLARGRTTMFNAACEPHVVDLGRLLNGMGARITGLGTNLIEIDGVDSLHGASHTVASDHVEIGSFIVAAAVTGGSITVEDCGLPEVAPMILPFHTLGIDLEQKGAGLRMAAPREMIITSDFRNAVPKIGDGIWPSFPSDMMSVAIVAATQARGTVLFFERLFESRMYFVDHLIEMGASIVQCDPHRVLVMGPSSLTGSRVSSPDIRAGMAMVIAALCAEGESIIENAQVIDRGYENIEKRLRALGAVVRRQA